MQKVCLLQENDRVPEFSTTDSQGNLFSKQILLGKRYLLYFYPRDNTPSCTLQACGFRDYYDFFIHKQIDVFGVSGDSEISHEKFRTKFSLPFPLLLDESNELAKSFGVWGKKKFMGRIFEGIHRTSFLIEESGKIESTYSKVNAKTHLDELMDEL